MQNNNFNEAVFSFRTGCIMLSRLCVTRSAFSVTHALKTPVPQRFVPKNYVVRNYAREPRSRVATRSQPTVWERLMAPAGPNGK